MAKWGVLFEAPDLPITSASMCTNCGQIFDFDERIGILPEAAFWPDGDWDPIEAPDSGVWDEYCPTCSISFSAKPPRPIIIMDADTYPRIEDLIKERDSLQKQIRIHKSNLHRYEERLAMAGPLAGEGVTLENYIDSERRQILTLEQELHIVEKEIRNKLA